MPANSRYTSLDGLRGVAALVVLVSHCCLASPLLALAVDSNGQGEFEPLVFWMTFTPLHLMWAGQEAVFVFFILSGFVLTLPFFRPSQPRWATYYAKRAIRIYLPVWASLIFALVMSWLVPRVASPEHSSWINLHDESPNPLADAVLLQGTGSLNSPLWSLQWEMLFSLLLPLYVLTSLRFKRFWLLGVLGLVLLIGAADLMDMDGLVFLPMFGIGAMMAMRRQLLEKWAARLGRPAWLGLVVTAILLLSSNWLVPQFPATIAGSTLGGAVLLFIVIGCKAVITIGNCPPIQWLGIRSFSLYLVHEPIVVTVAMGMRISDPLQVALVAVPCSFATAAAFYWLVEQPSQQLAASLAKAITARAGRREEPVVVRP
ncbi:acyltransferase family protein [Arthrobacter sp. B6]|uniref:acyltransferase family protein n=1 Tax=Arthrobacter sp. B6 TaxID=1570137 RepID=UPI00083540F8|nr:acyltransferase [Arthrobacter sp. B6]